ncbi:MAG: regulator of sigma E protease [Alteromonas naphthalenivorans]|jgi:regulator of sigma E protease
MGIASSISILIQKLPFIALGLTGIGTVMAFHEFGHFIFGKLFNVHVPQFSIGMGPKLISKKIGETTFSLSLIPVGAYVECGNDPKAAGSKERTLSAKSYWQKMLIVSGGILCNLIFAYFVLVGLLMYGIPANPILAQDSAYSVEKVLPDSAAEKGGIKAGDKIVSVNGIDVSQNIGALLKTVGNLPDQKASMIIERDNHKKTISMTVGSKIVKNQKTGSLGIQFSFPSMPAMGLTKSLTKAASIVRKLFLNTFKGISQAFTKRSAENFAGPLMMISLTADSAGQGMGLFFLFLAFISVGLAALNAIPLAVLDGGHALIYTIEAIIGKEVNETFQLYFQYISVALIGSLFLYLTFKDVFLLFLS